MVNIILSKLTRITSSGKYIEEIDGLRFIAIALVVFYHLNGYIAVNNKHEYSDAKEDYGLLNYFFEKGNVGVPLFFVISGFVLALPFAEQYLNQTKRVSLKKYFLRRLTRLEPPYLLVLVVMFLGEALVIHHQSVMVLLKSLLASAFYLHNVVFPGILPVINCVTWSLEIEVQFYILAPIIALVFRLGPIQRRIALIMSILAFPILQNYYPTSINWLYLHVQYFLLGFLIADFYICSICFTWPQPMSLIIGFICLLGFINLNLSNLTQALLILPCIFLFYMMALSSGTVWNLLLRKNALCVIGGMCYSIYLLHFGIIAFLGKILLKYRFFSYYILDLSLHFILLTISVLLVSSVFFYLVEKRFMRSDWYKLRA